MPDANNLPAFQVKNLKFPKISCHFLELKETQINLAQSFRIRAQIVGPNSMKAILGILVKSSESTEPDSQGKRLPVVQALVESVLEVELSQALPDAINSTEDIPLFANMVGILFPFVREKINYYLGTNGISFLMPIVNVQQFIMEIEASGKGKNLIEDLRPIKGQTEMLLTNE